MSEFYTAEYLADLAADGFAPAPRRPVALVADEFFTAEYVAAVLEDLAAEAARSGSGSADGDGDGDGAPTPAAPAARPVALALVAAHAGPAWMELSPADEAALDAFEQAIAEPLPCDACGKAASPGIETDEGLTLCLTCGEAEPAARAAVAVWRFAATCRRLAAARLTRALAGVS